MVFRTFMAVFPPFLAFWKTSSTSHVHQTWFPARTIIPWYSNIHSTLPKVGNIQFFTVHVPCIQALFCQGFIEITLLRNRPIRPLKKHYRHNLKSTKSTLAFLYDIFTVIVRYYLYHRLQLSMVCHKRVKVTSYFCLIWVRIKGRSSYSQCEPTITGIGIHPNTSKTPNSRRTQPKWYISSDVCSPVEQKPNFHLVLSLAQ